MPSAETTSNRCPDGRPGFGRGSGLRALATLLVGCTALVGCTSPAEWFANGFKVGPEYCPPDAPVAEDWIDAADHRVRSDPVEDAAWWTVFNDPVLNQLIAEAYQQDLTLREAGLRILEARAQRAIAAGTVFPQQQQVSARYSHNLSTGTGFDRHFSIWNGAFNLAWEVDFWGRFRRAVEAADADLEASVADYGDVLVTLVADVAATYVDIRTLQRRLELTRLNVETQRGTYEYAETRFREGEVSELDVHQSRSNLAQTEAQVPQLEIALRQSQNQLCILLGIPPEDLTHRLRAGPIPTVPVDVAVGIPAELLTRRPDVRRAERRLAAQSARIGVAEADLYPQIAVTGTIGITANQFQDLFRNGSSFGSVGPSFNWNVLNYGRILNNVRVQDARFQQLLLSYQQTVLFAGAEAENAIIFFLRSQQRLQAQTEAALAAERSNDLITARVLEGEERDFNRVFNVQNFKNSQESAAAQARGDVAQGLIAIYRALGGGWHTDFAAAAHLDLPLPTESSPEFIPPPVPQLESVPPFEAPPLPPQPGDDLPIDVNARNIPVTREISLLPAASSASGQESLNGSFKPTSVQARQPQARARILRVTPVR